MQINRYKSDVDDRDVDNPINKNQKRSILRNSVDEVTEQAVISIAIDNPALGQVRAINELCKQGVYFL
jgi:hypothetical protein